MKMTHVWGGGRNQCQLCLQPTQIGVYVPVVITQWRFYKRDVPRSQHYCNCESCNIPTGRRETETIRYQVQSSNQLLVHPTCLRKLTSGRNCAYCFKGEKTRSKKQCLRCAMGDETSVKPSFRIFKSRGGFCTACYKATTKGEVVYRLSDETYHKQCLDRIARGWLQCNSCYEWEMPSRITVVKRRYGRITSFCSKCRKTNVCDMIKPSS